MNSEFTEFCILKSSLTPQMSTVNVNGRMDFFSSEELGPHGQMFTQTPPTGRWLIDVSISSWRRRAFSWLRIPINVSVGLLSRRHKRKRQKQIKNEEDGDRSQSWTSKCCLIGAPLLRLWKFVDPAALMCLLCVSLSEMLCTYRRADCLKTLPVYSFSALMWCFRRFCDISSVFSQLWDVVVAV